LADYNAIAGVTDTLMTLLYNQMASGLSASQITSVPPDMSPSNVSGPWLNLYLYQVTENGSLKNQEMPGVGYPSDYGHPPLSLNLHYIITVHGTPPETDPSADIEAQQILGDAMQVLHDFSIIPPDLLQTKGNPGSPILDPSLLYEYERIKIDLKSMPIEEFAKIWTAFPQSNFRRSVAYEVSVIQIESTMPRTLVKPVKQRALHLTVMAKPQVSALYRTTGTGNDLRARIQDTLTIEGSRFLSTQTSVRLGKADPIVVVPTSETKISVTVPDDALLQPGPQLVQVLTRVAGEIIVGPPPYTAPPPYDAPVSPDETMQDSNPDAFILVPTVSNATPQAGNPPSLIVTGKRLYKDGLKTFVFVNGAGIPVHQSGGPPLQTSTSIQVPLPALQAGTYAVRVQVNGALNLEDDNVSFNMP
jgi:hypothetical protein